jgi:hypothetical protein
MTFQRSLESLILFAQFFGIPLWNQHSSRNCRFSIFNLFYSSIVVTSIIFMIFPLLIDRVAEGGIYERVVAVIFYGDCLMIAIIFGYISMKLKNLFETWQKFEFEFSDESGFQLSRVFVTIFMSLAFVEHLLSKLVVNEIAELSWRNETSSKFEAFSTLINKSFFEIFPFSIFGGFFAILACFYSTILWNFADCFLITIYVTMTIKLQSFNNKIYEFEMIQGFYDVNFWHKARRNFIGIHQQIKITNFVISPLVMMTVLNDFYFICHQLLSAFK